MLCKFVQRVFSSIKLERGVVAGSRKGQPGTKTGFYFETVIRKLTTWTQGKTNGVFHSCGSFAAFVGTNK